MPQAEVLVASGDVTLGEIYRLVQTQSDTLKEIKTELASRPTKEAMDAAHKEQDRRIGLLEDSLRWATKQAVGGLILGVGGIGAAIAAIAKAFG